MECRITYYDVGEFLYASFFATGFEENARRLGYHFEVSRRIPGLMRGMSKEWIDLPGICVFEIATAEKKAYFCIDARDSSLRAVEAGQGFHLPLLDAVDAYFKVNLNDRHVECDPVLNAHRHKLLPIRPFFPVRPQNRSRYLIPSTSLYTNARRAKQLLSFPSLDEMRRLRNAPKKRDVFFVMRCRNNPLHEAENEFRYRLIKELKSCPRIDSFAGLVGDDLNGKFREFEVKEMGLKEYLGHLAASRVAIYVRGLFDCLSFKLSQYLALGLPIVGQRLANNVETLMASESFAVQLRYEEPQEIVRRVAELLGRPDETRALGDSNRAAFEARFTPSAVVGELLDQLLPRLDSYARDN